MRAGGGGKLLIHSPCQGVVVETKAEAVGGYRIYVYTYSVLSGISDVDSTLAQGANSVWLLARIDSKADRQRHRQMVIQRSSW